MSNVVSIPSPALQRPRAEPRGLWRALVAALRHGRHAEGPHGLSERDLRDIGLTRSELGTIEWPSRGPAALTPPAGW
jgi:uncharacterized protein YjiS (DUF1127 family)